MKVVTVVDVRRDLDRVLDDLESTWEPIIVEDGGSVRAVPISVDDFERHFSDHQAEEGRRQVLERLRAMRARASGPVDTVQVLRGLRGYDAA